MAENMPVGQWEGGEIPIRRHYSAVGGCRPLAGWGHDERRGLFSFEVFLLCRHDVLDEAVW